MNKRRLLKLADLLEADAKNKKGIKFDLGNWATKSTGDNFDEEDHYVPVNCETSACAVGLACLSGAFKRSGLTYSISYDVFARGHVLTPTFDGLKSFSAVEAFFGLNVYAAEFLFATDRYPHKYHKGAVGERFVAKRIRDFVAGKVTA